VQFLDGKLDPIETLKLMEIVTQNEPERMEKGFSAYSDCSNTGKSNKAEISINLIQSILSI
jgi:hypothetical protein